MDYLFFNRMDLISTSLPQYNGFSWIQGQTKRQIVGRPNIVSPILSNSKWNRMLRMGSSKTTQKPVSNMLMTRIMGRHRFGNSATCRARPTNPQDRGLGVGALLKRTKTTHGSAALMGSWPAGLVGPRPRDAAPSESTKRNCVPLLTLPLARLYIHIWSTKLLEELCSSGPAAHPLRSSLASEHPCLFLPPRRPVLPVQQSRMRAAIAFTICALSALLAAAHGSQKPVAAVDVAAASDLVRSGGHRYLDVR